MDNKAVIIKAEKAYLKSLLFDMEWNYKSGHASENQKLKKLALESFKRFTALACEVSQ